jgi:putative ABC transport system substrate-binding protein
MFAACGSTGSKDTSASKDQSKSKTLKIGIIQFMEHPSLDTIRKSFIKELEAQGYKDGDNIKIDYQNGQGEQTNLKTISQKFVNNNYDLIVAIATPAALTAAGETKKIPVLFAACTDPISSGLVKSLDKPGANVSGTSDAVSAK